MTILADDIAAISSYNDGIVVETSPMTTAFEFARLIWPTSLI